jgi:hypothetical protein
MAGSFLDEKRIPEVKRNPWLDHLVRPFILTAMIACLSVGVVNLVRVINPAWHGTYFVAGMTLVSVEAIYSYIVLKRSRPSDISPLHYRLVEVGMLIILIKILTYSNKPLSFIFTDLQTIARTPSHFFSTEYLIFFFLATLAWGAATGTMKDFEALYDPFTFHSETIMPYNSLTTRFFWGGGILVFLSGVTQWISRAGWNSLVDFERSSIGGVIFNVLIYFMLGLVILSQAQLTMLLTRWEIQQVKVSPQLVKRWIQYGLTLLAIITLGVLFLPTGYTLGFLASAGLVLQFFIGILMSLTRLIILLMLLPFLWLMYLLGFGEATPPPPPTMPQAPPEAANPGGAPLPSWLEVARSFIFWILMLATIAYLVRTYLRDHPEVIELLKRFILLRPSLRWLINLWRRLAGWVQAGIDMIPKPVRLRPQSEAVETRQRWRWPRLGRMSARERILYYYLNTLKRSEKVGVVRQKHQTPTEFVPELNQTLPDLEGEVNLLTEAFVRARYSRDTFNIEHVSLVKTIWEQIRAGLRRTRKMIK